MHNTQSEVCNILFSNKSLQEIKRLKSHIVEKEVRSVFRTFWPINRTGRARLG